MRARLFAALLIAASATSASAAGAANSAEPHTVNSYTPQQLARAKAAITKAGRTAVALQNVQDGNFFFVATGNGMAYLAVFTSAGQLYFSNPLPVNPPTS